MARCGMGWQSGSEEWKDYGQSYPRLTVSEHAE
jgi:hypothetical protein